MIVFRAVAINAHRASGRCCAKFSAKSVFSLVRQTGLYGDSYHRKRLSMAGPKALVAVMRHFLRKLHGWYRSGQAFDAERHFTSSASYSQRQAA